MFGSLFGLMFAMMLALASAIAGASDGASDGAAPVVRQALLHGLAGEREVELPHVLTAGDFAAEGSRVRYRLQLELAQLPVEPLGVFVPKLSLAGALSLNGQLVAACGIGPLESLRCLHQPQLFVPPPALWRAGRNILEFELYADDRQMNGLSQVQVGPAVALARGAYGWLHLLQVELVQGLSWLSLCLGLFALAASAVLPDRERVHLWFGLAAIVNALSNLNALFSSPWVGVELFSWFVFSSRIACAPLICLTVLALMGKDGPGLRRVLLGYAVLAPVLIWIGGNDRMLTAALYVPIMLFAFGQLPVMLHWTLNAPSRKRVLVSLAFLVLVLAGVLDWLRLGGQSAFVGVYLVAYAINGMMLCFGGLLLWMLAESLNSSRALAATLDQQVAMRTADLEQANRRLAVMAETDGLTGIANRRAFDAHLAGHWQKAAQPGQPLALLMVDVDHFKQYNDHFGHQAGDDCLRRVAQVLQQHARRSHDLAARYGGEEFAIVTLGGLEQAVRLATAIRNAVEALDIAHPWSPFGRVTISVGVASLVCPNEFSLGLLLCRADEALYRAKSGGRNRVETGGEGAAGGASYGGRDGGERVGPEGGEHISPEGGERVALEGGERIGLAGGDRIAFPAAG